MTPAPKHNGSARISRRGLIRARRVG
jgi:hypothetical protein